VTSASRAARVALCTAAIAVVGFGILVAEPAGTGIGTGAQAYFAGATSIATVRRHSAPPRAKPNDSEPQSRS